MYILLCIIERQVDSKYIGIENSYVLGYVNFHKISGWIHLKPETEVTYQKEDHNV